jgi:hypothetical protein
MDMCANYCKVGAGELQQNNILGSLRSGRGQGGVAGVREGQENWLPERKGTLAFPREPQGWL